ncbi:bifunctional folylpolyglutamate synthase/dihydrofolate synthase [Campylobacter sp. 2018MI35]|uniref:Mur ligase family protein n=1 Tax=Campylobacter sp. 2018MI34 TaxID=2800582 RepID=UPI00190847F3|nr:Mur ligase family protein [Campylobacter sp. 2018MI34]MBK1991959.1 bifunctional folylpolyglutamate synthase/dihydrofolate synthase [Campylobacter sp. 2018MI34]
MNKVSEFLLKKSSNYDKIDRFVAFRMYEKYKKKLKIKPIIHIVGTNGKGSTGRYLTQLLHHLGYKVGHYTSPHLFSFNERFYLNSKIISDKKLELAHQKLSNIFKNDLEELSYFEYATFLAAILFKDCDYIIFEAGVGGEFDATSIFDKKLSIFTRIGFDHKDLLGNTLKDIARTKLKIMTKKALITTKQEKEVLDLAKHIAYLKKTRLYFNELLNNKIKNQFGNYAKKYQLPDFLKHNLNLALNACVLLEGEKRTFKAFEKLKALNLLARCQKINSKLYVDVGHNQMAAKALYERFQNIKIDLIYNSYLDKDIFEILKTLKPIIDTIKIYKYKDEQRKLANNIIFSIAKELNIKCEEFQSLNSSKISLVFGSFVLVQKFLKELRE